MDRREFFTRFYHLIIIIPFLGLWSWAQKQSAQLRRSGKRVKIALPKSDGLTLADGLIIHKSKENLKIYNRKCPHLGCQLNIDEKGEGLVCPCHGSRFDHQGVVYQGPSPKSLTELAWKRDKESIIVEVL